MIAKCIRSTPVLVLLASLPLAACMPYYPQPPRSDAYAQNGASVPGGAPFWAGAGPLWFGYHPPGRELTVDEVREGLQHWIAHGGNARLKAGKIAEKDGLTITAEVVTVDDSLVHKLDIDRRTGTVLQMDGGGVWRPWGPSVGAWRGGRGDWRSWMPCPVCGSY